MKFKFVGDLDVQDFVLKEIDTISKVSVVRLKLVLAQVVKGCLGEPIDVKSMFVVCLLFVWFVVIKFLKTKSLLLNLKKTITSLRKSTVCYRNRI